MIWIENANNAQIVCNTVTPHVVKVLERVVRNKIVHDLDSNDLICSIQQVFRLGRSCLTQLLRHFDDAMESIAHILDFDSIYLDFAK